MMIVLLNQTSSADVISGASIDPIAVIALIISIIALVPLGIFFIARYRYLPNVWFTFALSKEGDTYVIPNGQLEIPFSLHGAGTKDIIVEWVKVCSNPSEVTIMPSQICGFPQIITGYNDERFFRAIEFRPDERVLFVVRGSMIGYGTRYEPTMRDQTVREFELKFVARTRIDRAKIPFPFDMFEPKPVDHVEHSKFRIA